MITKIVSYNETGHNLNVDVDAFKDLILKALFSLHKGKPIFVYGRGVDSWDANMFKMAIRIKRLTGDKILFHIYGEDILDQIPETQKYLDSNKVFPNDLPNETKISLQKLIIENCWSKFKNMTNLKYHGIPKWRKEGEYDDD